MFVAFSKNYVRKLGKPELQNVFSNKQLLNAATKTWLEHFLLQ